MPEIEHGNVPEGFQNGTFLAATERLGRQVVQGVGQGIAGQVVWIDPDPVLQYGCVLQFQSVVDDKVRVCLNIGINLIHRYLGVERVGEQFPLVLVLAHRYVDVIILSLVAVVVSTRTVDVAAPRLRVRNPRTVPSHRIKVDLGRRFQSGNLVTFLDKPQCRVKVAFARIAEHTDVLDDFLKYDRMARLVAFPVMLGLDVDGSIRVQLRERGNVTSFLGYGKTVSGAGVSFECS